MSDLSDTSDQLWSLALQESSEWYQVYQALTLVARLGSKVVPSATLLQSKWSRTRHRMESLIVGACPSMVREELSSSRTQGLLEVLCKIHVIYRPGGLVERELGFEPQLGQNSFRGRREGCGRGGRFASRTWGGSVPDPAVLLRSLSVITSGPLATLPDVAFRVQLIKAQLQVDVTPTVQRVNQLYECILTELEGEVKYNKPSAKARSVKEEPKPPGPAPSEVSA